MRRIFGQMGTVSDTTVDSIAVPAAGSNAPSDAVADFSITGNPNGVWSYLASGAPLAMPIDGTAANTLPGLIYWWNGGSIPDSAIIGKNITGSVQTYSNTVQVPPDYLAMDPQFLADVAIIFTAPVARTYLITGSFLGIDTGEHLHQVEILDNGKSVFDGTISAFGQMDSFGLVLHLAAGDAISFVCDTGINGEYRNLSTGLAATVTPNPAGTIFTGTYLSGIVLSNPATQDPATVAATGYVTNQGNAVTGTNVAAWNFTNLGTIRAPGGGSTAIDLSAGGVVANGGAAATGAYIFGALDGVEIGNKPGTVVNYGSIHSLGNGGSDAAVALLSGGVVSNAASGVIQSSWDAVHLAGGGTIVNTGTIEGSLAPAAGQYGFGSGAALFNGGYVDNSGLIEGGEGVFLIGGLGTVVNSGIVLGQGYNGGLAHSGDGVTLGAGGTVTNGANGQIVGLTTGVLINGGAGTLVNDGVISGGSGVQLASGGSTLRNAGAITGYNGTAVVLGGSGDLLVVDPGGVFYGAIAGLRISDAIDLVDVRASGVTFAGAAGAGSLYVSYNGTVVQSFSLTGLAANYANGNFALVPDGNGGSDIQVARYLTGTYTSTVVLTAATPTAVETTAVVSVPQGNAVVNQSGSAAVLTNFGTISAYGYGGTAVYLNAGGTVSNGAVYGTGGVILGYAAGVALSGGNGTVVNAGTIAGTGAAGVGVLLSGVAGGAERAGAVAYYVQSLSNYGTISGYTGIVATGNYASLTNAGTVIGYGGTAVALSGGNDRLTLEPGAAFTGIADGGGGYSVLALAGPPSGAANVGAQYIGTLAGIGSSFVNFGTLVVEAGAEWEVSGNVSAYPFVNDGTIIVSNGIYPGGDTLVFGALGEDQGDSGVIELGNYGSAHFLGAVASGQTLVFTDATGVLQLGDPGEFAARISGFAAGDVIDFVDTTATAYRYAKGKLTLTDDGGKVAVLHVSGHYTKRDFQLVSDGAGGTEITLAAGSAARFAAPADYGFRPPLLHHPTA